MTSRTHTPEDIKTIMNEYDADYNYEREMRNRTLEEVAKEFDKMPFGDTSASFAIFVREMKR